MKIHVEPIRPRLMIARARFYAVCGRCLAYSKNIEEIDEARAWDEIASDGWGVYQHTPNAAPYPLCPSCAGTI